MRVLCAAATENLDLGELNIAQRGRHKLHEWIWNEPNWWVRNRQPVVTVTLDWLAERFPSPDIIKIDVEAGERLVFEGAKALLNRTRPHLVCEVASANSPWVTNFLLSLGYSFLDEHFRPTSTAIDNIVACLAVCKRATSFPVFCLPIIQTEEAMKRLSFVFILVTASFAVARWSRLGAPVTTSTTIQARNAGPLSNQGRPQRAGLRSYL